MGQVLRQCGVTWPAECATVVKWGMHVRLLLAASEWTTRSKLQLGIVIFFRRLKKKRRLILILSVGDVHVVLRLW